MASGTAIGSRTRYSCVVAPNRVATIISRAEGCQSTSDRGRNSVYFSARAARLAGIGGMPSMCKFGLGWTTSSACAMAARPNSAKTTMAVQGERSMRGFRGSVSRRGARRGESRILPQQQASVFGPRRRLIRRLLPEVVEAVDRAHFDVANIDALQHAQWDLAACRSAGPDFSVELGLRAHCFTAHRKDDVASL